MRVFKPLSKSEREVSATKARVQARLRSLSDVDRLVEAKVAMRPIQQVHAGKTTTVHHAKAEYERNRTLERTVSRNDRGSKIPRLQLGGRAPRRLPDSPQGYPHRTALQTVREYSGRSRSK